MSLDVNDPEIDALASRIAELRNVSETEAVRTALRKELATLGVCGEPAADDISRRVGNALAIVRKLHPQGRAGPVADKVFIDGLYED